MHSHPTQHLEPRIQAIGHALLSNKPKQGLAFLSPHKWSQMMLDKMMESESFRVASLRFTDVAPTLRNDGEFMEHLSAYFGEVGGLEKFIGDGIPGGRLLGKLVAPLVRKNIRSMATTFIAGETIDDGVKSFAQLHKDGLACSIDLLGEAVISKTEAEAFTAAYLEAIDKIGTAAAQWGDSRYPEKDRTGPIARANVSIKLSALYEHVNPAAHAHSVKVLSERFNRLLEAAMKHNAYIHVDMEQFDYVPMTLDVFRTVLLDPRFKSYPHVGIVCQAYLREGDSVLESLLALARERGTPFSIRLVKGAYWDYEQAHAAQTGLPCPVFDHKTQTDINYERMAARLIKAFPAVRPCFGTHNARTIAVAISLSEEAGLERGDIEFQVLNGMGENFRDGLRDMGYRVRQYCPVGAFIPGMSYLVRRLLENTANQSFVAMKAKGSFSANTLLAPPQAPQTPATQPKSKRPFMNEVPKDFSLAADRQLATAALKEWQAKLPYQVAPRINGATIKSNLVHEHTCPWQTSQKASRVTLASVEDAGKAVAAAKAALPAWQGLGFAARANILDKAANLMQARWQELFAQQVFEAGKDWRHADADIGEAIDFLRYYAHQARTLEGKFQPVSLWGESNKTIYMPKGVAAVIAPWNFPLAISCGMTAAALACGNTVIYKPAEQTSAIGQALWQVLTEAGVPAGALHFLPGKGEDVGAHLVAHKDVSLIAFTGSKAVGLHILEQSGKVPQGQTHTKKCVIEMGGKNAIIVDSDADLDEAVPGVVHAAFGFQGQKCSACSRVIVVGSAYDVFTQRLKEMVEGLKVGPANDPLMDVNAVIDAEAFDKISSYIAVGNADGTLLAQAAKPEGAGHYALPTVFTDLKKDSRLTTEEVFGPVLAVYRAKTVEEAVNMALDGEYALTGGFYSRNPKTIAWVKDNFHVGNLYINRGTTGAMVSRQPFGGGRLSGTGTKAGGPDYLLHFVEPRVVTENTMRRGYATKPAE